MVESWGLGFWGGLQGFGAMRSWSFGVWGTKEGGLLVFGASKRVNSVLFKVLAWTFRVCGTKGGGLLVFSAPKRVNSALFKVLAQNDDKIPKEFFKGFTFDP